MMFRIAAAMSALFLSVPAALHELSLQTAATSSLPSIPFEIVNRHVVLRATVNGSRPLSFLLDTGATPAIIKLDVARGLGLKLEGVVEGRGSGAAVTTGSNVRNAKWALLEHPRFSQPMRLALPLTRLSPALGHDVDGIIGGDFIREFVVEINFETRRLTLHDRRRFRYSGSGEAVPIDFEANDQPVLKADVTPINRAAIPGTFLFDIGSGLALALHTPFVNQHRLLDPERTTMPAIGVAGAGGNVTGQFGRTAELRIGSFRFTRPITFFSQDRAGSMANPALAGNVGFQIASRFRLFLDYERRRIIFEPTSRIADPFDRAFSGVAIHAEGENYRTFRIKAVQDRSAGSEAGLHVEDVITAINGTQATELTLTTLLESLERAVAHQLTIRRGADVLAVTLTPRKLE